MKIDDREAGDEEVENVRPTPALAAALLDVLAAYRKDAVLVTVNIMFAMLGWFAMVVEAEGGRLMLHKNI